MSRRVSHGISRRTSVVVPETAIPDGGTVATTCPYCDRPFRRERLRDLHVGDVHKDLSDDETTVYEATVEIEAEGLFVYHLRIVGALGVVFTVLFLLAVVSFSL